MTYIIATLFGYLLGSIPFGLVLCKIFCYGDIRKIGSGNIGATNVLRTGNKLLAFITLILDIGKGAIAVLIALKLFDYNTAMLAGFGALLGHLYPLWIKFKGGKGVATTLGTLIALSPIVGIITCSIWILTAVISRISSLSALIAIGLSPLIAYFLQDNSNLPYLYAAIAAIVWIKHLDNIKRLLKGEEPKIGRKRKIANE